MRYAFVSKCGLAESDAPGVLTNLFGFTPQR
jgi:hypothetical protein